MRKQDIFGVFLEHSISAARQRPLIVTLSRPEQSVVSLGGQGLKRSRETKERAKVRRRMKDETDDHTDHGGGGSKQESDDNGVVAVIISGV